MEENRSIAHKVLTMVYADHRYSSVRLRTEKICKKCGCEMVFMNSEELFSCQSCFAIHKEERFAS